MDHYIGKLLYKLEELGYFDNSIIIFVLDHEHPLSDHGKFLKGPDRMYNELLKVMFMIRFPQAEYGGQRLDALSQFRDILPTILDAIGLKNNLETLQGRSLMPLIKGETKEFREAIVTGHHDAADRCIRDKVGSYILRPDPDRDELYNLIDDPGERVNLIDDYPQEAVKLRRSSDRRMP